MIKIEAVMDKDGLFKRCVLKGHAGAGAKGADIVCAAVSALVRTAAAVFSRTHGITARFEADSPGNFFLEASVCEEEKRFFAGAGTFLLEGLAEIAEEYPKYCRMTIFVEKT
jgi:uncharacterized protein YsxB (DUF464 family)